MKLLSPRFFTLPLSSGYKKLFMSDEAYGHYYDLSHTYIKSGEREHSLELPPPITVHCVGFAILNTRKMIIVGENRQTVNTEAPWTSTCM